METIERLAKRMGEIAIDIHQHQEERNSCFTRIEELRARERELDVRLMDLRAHLTRLSDRLVELHQKPVDAELTGNSLHRVFEDHDGRQQEVAEQAKPWIDKESFSHGFHDAMANFGVSVLEEAIEKSYQAAMRGPSLRAQKEILDSIAVSHTQEAFDEAARDAMSYGYGFVKNPPHHDAVKSPEERAEETEAKRRAEGKAMDSFHADDFKKMVFGPGSSELVEAYVHSQQQDQAGPVAGAVDRRWWSNLTDKELDGMLSYQKTLFAQGGDERSAFACVVNGMLLARRDELGGNDPLRPLTDSEFSWLKYAVDSHGLRETVERFLKMRRGEM